MKEIILNVEGMMCGGCEKRIENAVSSIEGVSKVSANHENGTVTVSVTQEIDQNKIKEKIENIGFTVKERDDL